MRVTCFVLALWLWSQPALAQGFDIVILAGQSNSTEAGHGAYTDPNYSEATDARIKQVGRYQSQDMTIVPVGEMIDGTKYDALQHWTWAPGRRGKGFGLTFARKYIRARRLDAGRSLLLIPAGRGSTSILEWRGFLADKPESKLLYPDMLARVRFGLETPGSRVVAVLWSQMERDIGFHVLGTHDMNPADYGRHLRLFFRQLRIDLPGNYPITTTRTSPDWFALGSRGRAKADFERQAASVIRNHDPIGNIVKTFDLNGNEGDPPHFDAASMVTLGLRHFVAWRGLVP